MEDAQEPIISIQLVQVPPSIREMMRARKRNRKLLSETDKWSQHPLISANYQQMNERKRKFGELSDSGLKIHQKRCSSDPMYTLFYFPKSTVNVKLDSYPTRKDEEFLLYSLNVCLEFYRTRYGKWISEEGYISKGFALCFSGRAKASTMIFAFLFLIESEPELQDFFGQFYGEKSESTFRTVDDFNRMCLALPKMVRDTVYFPFSISNIKTIIKNFNTAAMSYYLDYFLG